MIWNYGTLPESITLEDLRHKHASHPRNPILADVFFKGGLIESWGRGTLKIIAECKAAGLPEPEITEMTGGIAVVLFKDIYNEKYLQQFDLNGRQLEALLFWKKSGEILTSQYQEKFNISDRTSLRDLTELIDNGLLTKTGKKKTAKYLFKGRNVG